MQSVRILIADDHEAVRSGLRRVLETQPGWSVVGEAKDGWEAVEGSRRLKPDVIVLDFGMPRLNGLEATKKIATILPGARILILTMHDSDELARAAREAGAHGYLTKSEASSEVVAALQALQQDTGFFAPRPTSCDPADGQPAAGSSSPQERPLKLTTRQTEIIRLVAEGKSSKEVAQNLNLSVKTVDTHRANIMKKLHCHSVGELIRYAIRNNIANLE